MLYNMIYITYISYVLPSHKTLHVEKTDGLELFFDSDSTKYDDFDGIKRC